METVASEEFHLEGQTEERVQSELSSLLFESSHQCCTNSLPEKVRRHGQGSDFTQVFPKNVQRTASHNVPVRGGCHGELLDCFIEHHEVLAQKHTCFDEGFNQSGDSADVRRARTSNCPLLSLGHQESVALRTRALRLPV